MSDDSGSFTFKKRARSANLREKADVPSSDAVHAASSSSSSSAPGSEQVDEDDEALIVRKERKIVGTKVVQTVRSLSLRVFLLTRSAEWHDQDDRLHARARAIVLVQAHGRTF